VRELPKRLPWFQLLDLQKMYVAVPVKSVARCLHLGADQTFSYLEELISSGQLNATISLPDDRNSEIVLRFYTGLSSGPLAKTEEQHYANLVRQTDRTNILAEYVKLADRRLSLNRFYIEALRKKLRNKGDDVEGILEQQEQSWQAEGFQDEDLMEVA
jgi:COP9 signalosome complex subunit 3